MVGEPSLEDQVHDSITRVLNDADPTSAASSADDWEVGAVTDLLDRRAAAERDLEFWKQHAHLAASATAATEPATCKTCGEPAPCSTMRALAAVYVTDA